MNASIKDSKNIVISNACMCIRIRRGGDNVNEVVGVGSV